MANSAEPVRAVLIDPSDNVATLTSRAEPGSLILLDDEREITASAPIPNGHKIALISIEPGEPIRKYGQVIGVASEPITVGSHVHTHNLTGQGL
ncbi:MAG: D-galactarate dehydratase [Acidobacteria bacterium]|nr:MAG: D-galactarate dehydratase [Acidobacteriota bacterium]